ncbi:MAG: hypothetical protein KC635_28555 [Myxococcales bacterium]|nr:hypothetical protein [Myxococcales bacterium]MCB9731093.1 hypothetical protein [Deltaproteobacteria bacterium]
MLNAAPADLAFRLAPFTERGLIPTLPTDWQLVCGQVEMAPYVVMPDKGDRGRYAGALLGHPLLRQPVVLSQVGLDHFRVGHGLQAGARAQFDHLAFVFHEGMPVYDLQVCQTHPRGLERLREHLEAIDAGATPRDRARRRLADLVIPDAAGYRRRFLEPGGYIDRAAAFDYDGPAADFLRPEFTSLVSFMRYCADAFEAAPARKGSAWWRRAGRLANLGSRRFREWKVR